MKTWQGSYLTLSLALLTGLAACSDDGTADSGTTETETGDGDGDGDGDGGTNSGDGDGDSGDGDGDSGDGDGDTGGVCGDGVVDPGEECDDGNMNDADACSNACTLPLCGDGVVQDGEECDDGNPSNEDACLDTCVAATCGDGYVGPGEGCDDGNDVDDDECNNACMIPGCGDGVLQEPEGCDDGNLDDTDDCPATCQPATCGDGYVWLDNETCDDGNAENTDDCLDTCEPATCGDGFVWEGNEECDDGNMDDNDDCVAMCVAPVCGDGFVWAGNEQCDDGNLDPGDGCDETCASESVGKVFLTSSNGTAGFYGYTIADNSWATLTNPPSTTRSQITNDGTAVYLMGANNIIYEYDIDNDSWSNLMAGPGNLVSSPIGFFQWFSEGFYYLKDGQATMYVYRNGNWSSFALGGTGSSAGSWDAVNQELYIRTYSQLGFRVIDTTNDSIVRTITDATGVGENSRTGSYLDGYFYSRTFTDSLQRLDAQNGMKSDTGADPTSDHTGTDSDFQNGLIYISGYGGAGTSFQVFDSSDDSLTTLANQPNVSNHSTITVMR